MIRYENLKLNNSLDTHYQKSYNLCAVAQMFKGMTEIPKKAS